MYFAVLVVFWFGLIGGACLLWDVLDGVVGGCLLFCFA